MGDPNRPVPAEQAPQGPKYAYLDDDDSSTIEGMIRKNGNDLIGALGEKDHSVISRSEWGKKADIAPSEMESVVSSAYSKMSDNTVRMNDLNLKNGAQPGFTMKKKKMKKGKKVKEGKGVGPLMEQDYIMYDEEKWQVTAMNDNLIAIHNESDPTMATKYIDITKEKFEKL